MAREFKELRPAYGFDDVEHGTGCTAILSDVPATAGIEVRGAAPGSRETELLHPLAAAQWVNGVMLSGGSVFGLDAPGGVLTRCPHSEFPT